MIINSLKLVGTGSAEKHFVVGYGGQRLDTSPSLLRQDRMKARKTVKNWQWQYEYNKGYKPSNPIIPS